jgi:hypothetical protein
MESIGIALASAAVLAAIVLVLKQRHVAANRRAGTYLSRLEEVVRSSEHTRRACFLSLENMHRSLGALETRADTAEQKLGNFIEAPQIERKEHYEAAALLLAAGQSAERVATLLNLPTNQVQLVQELSQFAIRNNRARANGSEHATRPMHKNPKKKPARRRGWERGKPILLSDIVEPGDAASLGNGSHPAAFNGTAA